MSNIQKIILKKMNTLDTQSSVNPYPGRGIASESPSAWLDYRALAFFANMDMWPVQRWAIIP